MRKSHCWLLGLAIAAAGTPNQVLTALSLTRARPPISSIVAPQGRSSISGQVFSEAQRPVSDVFVELLNELDVTITQVKTDGAGRYAFSGLPEGRFKVRVSPYGTDYGPQTREIIIAVVGAVPGSGSVNEQADFYLKVKAEALAGPFAVPGSIFAQDVPGPAKKLYEKGIGELREKKEKEGFESLKKSLEIFPTYYLALDRLGTEYALRGNQNRGYYEAAVVLLTKALEINPRSYSSAFGLGFAQYYLGLVDKATENLERAVNLYGKAVNGYLMLGMAHKRAGKLAQAEAAYKRANELGKGKVADVHWQLAGLYSDQKRHKEAADELELFLKTQSNARDAEKIKQLIKQLREKAASK